MAMPPVLVGAMFLVAVASALGVMAYLAWRGSKPSDFFLEAVRTTYDLQLPEGDIDSYYELKDRLQRQYAPEAAAAAAAGGGALLTGRGGSSAADAASVTGDFDATGDPSAAAAAAAELWVRKVPPEEFHGLQKALMRRLVGCIDKLDQVQRDKPGNWKLWRGKLVSERYWGSLCDAEKLVTEEIDACIAEAGELEPGWRDHIFPQAVQCWRMQKQHDMEKYVQKKAVKHEKKQKEKEQKRSEVEERLKEEDKLRQERLAEKAMEKLLREEEKAATKPKAKPKVAVAKAKGQKKK